MTGEDSGSDLFDAPDLVAFSKKFQCCYNAVYSAIEPSDQSRSVRPTPDVYLAAARNLSGKELVEWKGDIEAEYRPDGSGQMKGTVTYRGRMKFSDDKDMELELEYSAEDISPFWVEQFLNAVSCSMKSEMDLPRAGIKDIKSLKGRAKTENKIGGTYPPQMTFTYSSETSVSMGGEEVVLKKPDSMDTVISVRYKDKEKGMKSQEISSLELMLFMKYLSSSNRQADKPRLKVDGESVDMADYLDKYLLSELKESVCSDLKAVRKRHASTKKRVEELEEEVGRQRSRLTKIKEESPTAKESIKRADNALLSAEKELKKHVMPLLGYASVMMSAYIIKNSMMLGGFKGTYMRYDDIMKSVFEDGETKVEDFIKGLNGELQKYQGYLQSFQLGFGGE